MTVTRRSLWPLLAWVAGLGVAIVTFSTMGSGALATPALTEPGAWSGWAADRDPVVALVALLRLLVLALAWYLLVTTLAGVVGHLSRSRTTIRATDAVSPRIVRRVVRTSLGAGLAAAVAVSTVGPVRLDHSTPAAASEAPPPSADAPRMRPLPPVSPGAPMAPGGSGSQAGSTTPSPQVPTPASPPPAAADMVTVEVGDHLWAIAESQVRQHLDDPTDRDVARYWRRVVTANRDRLVDRANPDLVLPGQRFVLPPFDVEGAP